MVVHCGNPSCTAWTVVDPQASPSERLADLRARDWVLDDEGVIVSVLCPRCAEEEP